MAGMEDHVSMLGDWGVPLPPSPGSKHFFSSLLGENVTGSKPFFDTQGDYMGSSIFTGSSQQQDTFSGVSNGKYARQPSFTHGGQLNEPNCYFEERKVRSGGGGLVERIAARAGFNAPRLNTESINRCTDRSLNPDASSPYLTIPPGLSPTTLLDSPVFLSNSLAQPSPTTGTFFNLRNSNSENFADRSKSSNDNNSEDINASSFEFRPVMESGSVFLSSAAAKVVSASTAQPDLSISTTKEDSRDNLTGSGPRDVVVSGGNEEFSPPLDDKQDEEGVAQRDPADSAIGSPSEDGYNWRKYGQKQVKGSEYPRGYYKCTHPDCQVKKKVEQSHEGHITEIIYTGGHNHPKPFPNRRPAIGSSTPFGDTQLGIPDCGAVWRDTDKRTGVGASEWRNDNFEVTSIASVPSEFLHQSSKSQTQHGTYTETGEAVDASSTFSNNEDEDDRGTHGSASLGGYDGEGHEESESKRRKVESYPADMSGNSRAIREPRVVVQTTSEVDILDDGYRWRKYGQKVVKGNPNPRSYYKCTSAGCSVRKHVERASHDLKSVITTYEGKHNHDVPVARNSSHVNISGAASNSSLPLQTASLAALRQHQPHQQQFRPSNGFTFGMNQPQHGYSNFPMVELGTNHANLPILHSNQYLGQRYQYQLNDMGFMMPKGEPKV